MEKKLQEIDASAIEKLVEIKTEKDRLQSFRDKAEEMKDRFDEDVYRRVLDDYDRRQAALEEQAAPLMTEASKEYAKLRSIYDELSEAMEAARGASEELEFRHAVGELDEEQLAERLKERQQVLKKCEKNIDAVNKLNKQFLEAIDSEEELGAGVPAPAAGRKAVAETSPAATTVLAPEESPAATTVLAPEESPAATIVASAEEAAGAPQGEAERTMVLPPAKLVLLKDGEPSQEYPLGIVNYVGRDEDNHIRVAEPTVSRKHAVVEGTPSGFNLKDLGSGNGTLVNDEKVTERRLSAGDRIRLGDVEFLFDTR